MQLTEAFTPGDLTPEAYKNMNDGLRHRRAEIERLIQRQPVPEEQLNARLKKTLEMATSLWDLYEPLDDARRARGCVQGHRPRT